MSKIYINVSVHNINTAHTCKILILIGNQMDHSVLNMMIFELSWLISLLQHSQVITTYFPIVQPYVYICW